MWDEASGTFLSVNRDTLEKIPVATIGSWIPLMAEVPTDVMAKRMAEAIQTDHWNTPLPVPTVDRKDKRWKSDDYWRGDVWPAPNYQIAKGLALYGHKEAAAQIADKNRCKCDQERCQRALRRGVGKTAGRAFPRHVLHAGDLDAGWALLNACAQVQVAVNGGHRTGEDEEVIG